MQMKIAVLLIASFLFSICSCEIDPLQTTIKTKGSDDILSAKIDTDDKEVAPADEDLSCVEDSDCVIIDKGCCQGEKLIAVNKDKSLALVQKRSTDCGELKKAKNAEILKERQERAEAVGKARKEKDKKEARKILDEFGKKAKESKHELCYRRQGTAERGQVPQCHECKCTLVASDATTKPIGQKCIAAKDYLLNNRAEMLKALSEAASSAEKKNGIIIWNKLIQMVANSQECACEKYLKDLEEIIKKLKPAEEAPKTTEEKPKT